MIGYCPQVRGLNDFMTGRQHLLLYAALRGIPYENLIDEVNKWIDLLGNTISSLFLNIHILNYNHIYVYYVYYLILYLL